MESAGMFAPLSEEEAAVVEAPARRSSTKTPIVPVPSSAPPMTFKHPKLGAPTRSWAYHDGDGQLVGYVCRWDFIDADGKAAKEILPVTFCDLGNGRTGWRSKGIPSPRPLYGLPEIDQRQDATVMVVEGEKTRDAAALLFPEIVVTTPAHGAKSPQLTDFGPCAGRTVIIVPDHDEPGRTNDKGRPLHPGRDFGDKVAELVRAAGASEVLRLAPEILGLWRWVDGERIARGDAMPDGWDIADAVADGWTAETAAGLLDVTPYPSAEDRAAEGEGDAGEGYVWPFRIGWNGVEKRVERADRETGIITVEWKWFCSALEVKADTRSAEGEEWGRLLTVTDRDGRVKDWGMPMAMLAGDGTSYRERLLSLGLVMAPGKFARDALHEYISTARPDTKARCVGRVGWHLRAFALSNQTVEHGNG
ncbi:DUF927 domain-containing protein [Methylobacterium sp. Leaf100]|uniref:DUF927 domain-containing protein n=1 Tax=Methylobacterium sp. Leaf100 TaxID=1736252 RepID=UPI0007011AD1|nr:DUF927 domain-containing protein [Methylobacterium sp. Leaf100]KQP24986.1 hypothetical protein ASF25_21415 [Methylobacterium sp. Leaf100]